jgi:SAM-dependent methyltransferase
MQNKAFDSYADDYEKVLNRHLPPGMEHADFLTQKREWMYLLIKRFLSLRSSLKYLDFGCGIGSLCEALSEHPHVSEVVGVDESSESRRMACERISRLNQRPGSLPNVGFQVYEKISDLPAGAQFDLITAVNVFHHIAPEKRADCARELTQQLSEGGILVVWEHNPWNPFTRFLVRICPFDRDARLIPRSKAIELWKFDELELQINEYINITPPSFQRFKPVLAVEGLLGGLPLGAQYRLAFIKTNKRILDGQP